MKSELENAVRILKSRQGIVGRQIKSVKGIPTSGRVVMVASNGLDFIVMYETADNQLFTTHHEHVVLLEA